MVSYEDIQRVLTWEQSPVVALYLNVNAGYQENQAINPEWRIWLKNKLREMDHELNDGMAAQWKPIRERIDRFFETYMAGSRGLAFFASEQEEAVFELPLAVDNGITFAERANVMPLFWQLDEYEPYLIALVDQQEARFLLAHLGTADQKDQMTIDLDEYDFREKTINPGGAFGGNQREGYNRDAFEDTLDDHRSRFYRDVVAQIESLIEKHGADRIVLGGAEASAAAVQNLMPAKLAAKVVSSAPIPLRASLSEVVQRFQDTALEFERQYEAQLLDEVINLAKGGGRGALGHKDVLEALEQQRVELLIAPWPLNDEQLLRELPGRVLSSSSKVELVHGEAADRLRQEGGLAARLYYAISTPEGSYS